MTAARRCVCLGGGPGGLYAALLLKKSCPDRHVEVIDRNPPGATYGWGVVFSDETLGFLRDADAPSYEAIVERFVHWTAIETRYRGETIRSGGHAFSGIGRHRLLSILEGRCREVGVVLRSEEEWTDIAPFAHCDLIVVADGLNSSVRGARAEIFKPHFDRHATRFIWFGARLRLDAFTFMFRNTEHGMFTVHAYPFDAETSTFIVECREETWRAAGLDEADEAQSIRFCEALFADQLAGSPLLSNRSSWITFVTLRNQTWHHENLVLLGDAAHTAHFSVGSGTKMAMEDGIALAGALERHPSDLRRALVEYEELRMPSVERTQAAARDSSRWFEHVSRYAAFEPTQFAFSLLTRSKRVTYENLRLRDEGFSRGVDAWFARGAWGPDDLPPNPPPQPALTPFRVGNLNLPNRVAVKPPSASEAVNGLPTDWHIARLGGAATSGVGLVMTEMVAATPDGRITPGSAGMYAVEHREGWRRVTDIVRRHSGAHIGIQLGHAGRRGSTRPRREGADRPLAHCGWPLVAPSPIPYTSRSAVPHQMDEHDMERVRDAFVQSALWAREAGFSLLELHMGEGYLLGSFLSPLSNTRDDGWGGSPEARRRYPLEVVRAVRAAWPSPLPLSACISATDWARGGVSEGEVLDTARALKDEGVDLIHVSSGGTTGDANPQYGRAWQAPFAEAIRNDAGVPTLVGGNLAGADEMNTLLAGGRADLCLVAPRLLGGLPWLRPEPEEPSLRALKDLLLP